MSRPAATGLLLIGASAGSGKTTRLTQEVIGALDPGSPARIPTGGLFAVTYTRAAATELIDRVRQRLSGPGASSDAARLPLAYLGTVHSVCLRLIEEHAIDAGLSPRVEVLAEDAGRLLRQALESCIPDRLRLAMDDLAARLQIGWDGRVQRHDWLRPVIDIMELARGNRVALADLPRMAERSAAGLLRLLPAPAASGAELEDELVRELARAADRLAGADDSTKATREVAGEVARALARARRERLPWSEWLRLAKLAPAKASRPLVAELRDAAAAVASHPGLREDIAAFTGGVFEAARAGLEGFAAWKAERRLVDYGDMIDLGLELAHDPPIAAELADTLRLIVVDELQDTSPLQLALFMRLHRLAGRSVMVGDRKQCIFEYAGADPELMEAMVGWVGAAETLAENHRSRPELVGAVTEIFVPAFARSGMPAGEVAVTASREAHPELAALTPFGLLWLEGRTSADDAAALADGVVRLLARPEATPVIDRTSRRARPVRPGDVAILVATNAEALAIARALAGRGIGAALARPGLVATPEGTLAEAALRWLVDPADSLAAAVLDALTGWNGLDPDDYLAARIRARAGEGTSGVTDESSWRAPLERVRGRLDELAPSEAMHLALAALDAATLCARWPDPAQRLGNVDALQAMAAEYERRAARQGEAATLVGLLRTFAEAARPVMTREGERARDDQHVQSGEEVVTITTYHRAKGLEWPVVILASLDRRERRSPFDVCPESDQPAFDPDAPLAGRWIRCWPWPFGAQRTAPLAEAALASPEGQRVAAREDRERVRLLYVGFTRARDHLVLAIRRVRGVPRSAWLDDLCSPAGHSLVSLPLDAADGTVATVGAGDASVSARVWVARPGGTAAPVRIRPPARRFHRPPLDTSAERPPYRLTPSRAATDWPDLGGARTGELVALGPRVQLRRAADVDWETAGRTIHAFFAADAPGLAPDERACRAARLLAAAGLAGHIDAGWLLAAADSLSSFVGDRWPGARCHREMPLVAFLPSPHGRRRIDGTIDLLVDAGPRIAVIDHKSYPAWSDAACRAKARDLAPQLLAYRRALALLDRPAPSLWFHFPLAGLAVELIPEEGIP